jgi:hypothetical protein
LLANCVGVGDVFSTNIGARTIQLPSAVPLKKPSEAPIETNFRFLVGSSWNVNKAAPIAAPAAAEYPAVTNMS